MRIFIAGLVFLPVFVLLGDDGERLVSIDHYVRVRSAVPVIAGQDAEIYVERWSSRARYCGAGPL